MTSEAERNLSGEALNDYDSLRKATVRADLERRLRRACAHLTDAEFLRLVDVMADRQIKSERRKALD